MNTDKKAVNEEAAKDSCPHGQEVEVPEKSQKQKRQGLVDIDECEYDVDEAVFEGPIVYKI